MSSSNAAIPTSRRPKRNGTLRSFLLFATLGLGVSGQPSLAHAQLACESLPLPAACVSFAFAYAYVDSCIQRLQTPCPPTLLMDESIPNAPGEVTSLDTVPLNFRFADLFGTGALSLVQADLIRLDPAAPIPCPEPAFSILWPGVLAWAASAVRLRRRA